MKKLSVLLSIFLSKSVMAHEAFSEHTHNLHILPSEIDLKYSQATFLAEYSFSGFILPATVFICISVFVMMFIKNIKKDIK